MTARPGPARPGPADRAVIRCLRRIAIAGLAGGLAMIPVGLVLRFTFGQSVNVYGELIVIRIAGRLDPLLLAIEHGAVSLAMAAPLVAILHGVRHRAAIPIGLVYGGAAWFVVNTLALPWIFDQPTPWQIGSQAIWGSLIVHLVFGLAVALVSRHLARARSTLVRALSGTSPDADHASRSSISSATPR